MTLPSPSRRAVLQAALGVSLTAAMPARAEDLHPSWPSRPIRLIVPYPPGGAADTVARIFAEDLRPMLRA
jgi:tripartite-type tricarboxylate transporter receptor subunit TctC